MADAHRTAVTQIAGRTEAEPEIGKVGVKPVTINFSGSDADT